MTAMTEEDLALERLQRAFRDGEQDLIIKVDRSDELRVRVAGFAVEHIDGVRRVSIRLEAEAEIRPRWVTDG